MTEALFLKGVTAGYGETHVLEGVDLALAPGESLSIIGRNGVGKSTLLETVMGHTTLHAGEIRLDGQRIDRAPAHARALAGLSYVPQEREIFPSLSVRENLELCARTGAWTLARVFDLFPNLRSRLANAGTQLSGGEQQMLAIGRALMSRPRVLLLDEPSLGLAPILVHTIFEAIEEIHRQGTPVLLVEQNANAALKHSNRAYVLETGTVALEGTSAEVAANPRVKEAYLGE